MSARTRGDGRAARAIQVKPYVIGDQAEQDLIDALVYEALYWGDSGCELHAVFLAAFERIGRSPGAFPSAGYGNRMLILQGVPFAIVYLDQPHRVWITAVANTNRRYGYWRLRKPPRD